MFSQRGCSGFNFLGCEAVYPGEWFAYAASGGILTAGRSNCTLQTSVCYGRNGTGRSVSTGTSTSLYQLSSTSAPIGPLQTTHPQANFSNPTLKMKEPDPMTLLKVAINDSKQDIALYPKRLETS